MSISSSFFANPQRASLSIHPLPLEIRRLGPSPESGPQPAVEKKAVQGKASIQKGKVICLECGRQFRQLGKSHLTSHGLTAKEYKKKHGVPLGQALTSKDLSAKRRKVAKEKGLGQKLAKTREKRAKA